MIRFKISSLLFALFSLRCMVCLQRGRREETHISIEEVFDKFHTVTTSQGISQGSQPVSSGSCSYTDSSLEKMAQNGWIFVAAGSKLFQSSLACGLCLEIQGRRISSRFEGMNSTFKAIVTDHCDKCSEDELGHSIAGDDAWDIKYKAINCPPILGVNNNIQFQLKYSNPSYLRIQVLNSKLPVLGVELHDNGLVYCLVRTTNNYFVLQSSKKLSFPLKLALTSIAGETLWSSLALDELGAVKNKKYVDSKVQFKNMKTDSSVPRYQCRGQRGLPLLNVKTSFESMKVNKSNMIEHERRKRHLSVKFNSTLPKHPAIPKRLTESYSNTSKEETEGEIYLLDYHYIIWFVLAVCLVVCIGIIIKLWRMKVKFRSIAATYSEGSPGQQNYTQKDIAVLRTFTKI